MGLVPRKSPLGQKGKMRFLLLRCRQAVGWTRQHKQSMLAGIFILALLVRVSYIAVFVGFDSLPTYDGTGYDRYATNLLAGKGLSDFDGPTAFRMPLYSLSLAFTYLCFGHSYAAARAMQVLLGSLACVAMYFVGTKLFSHVVGLLASLGICLHPLGLYMTGEFYSETLLLFLLMMLLLSSIRVIDRRAWKGGGLVGLWLGLGVLTKPSTILLVPFCILWLLCRRSVSSEKLLATLSLLLVFVLVMTPWVVRNYLVFEAFVPLATEGGVSLWAGNNPLADGQGVIPSEENWQGEDYPDLRFRGWSRLGEVESDHRFFSTALDWIRENPFEFVSLMPRKLARLWSPASFAIASKRSAHPLFAKIIWIPYALFLLAALVGFVVTWRDRQKLFLVYSLIFAANLSAAIVVGGTRYSMPMVPSLVLLASAGICAACRGLDVRSYSQSGI